MTIPGTCKEGSKQGFYPQQNWTSSLEEYLENEATMQLKYLDQVENLLIKKQ